MKTKQFDYDDRIVLIADFRNGEQIGDVSVILYVDKIDYDITKAVDGHLKEKFEKFFQEKLDEEEAGRADAKAEFDMECDRDDALTREE